MVYKKFVLKRGWGRLKILKKGDDIGKEGAGFGKGVVLRKGRVVGIGIPLRAMAAPFD